MTASVRSFSDNRQLLRGGSGGGLTTTSQVANVPQGISQALGQGPVTRGPSLDQLQSRRSALLGNFNRELGPSLRYTGTDRVNILNAVDKAGQGNTSFVGDVQEILGREYTGPTGLGEGVQALTRQAEDQRQVFGLLGRGEGVESHLRALAPGMTAGEARGERRRLGGNFYGGAKDAARGFGQLANGLRTDATDAARRAAEQAGFAGDARSQARDLLSTLQTQVVDSVDRNVTARGAERDRLSGIFEDLLGNPLDGGLLESAGLGEVGRSLDGNAQIQDRRAAEGVLGGLENFADLSTFTARDNVPRNRGAAYGPGGDRSRRGESVRTILDPVTGQEFRVDMLQEGFFRNVNNRRLNDPSQEFQDALPRLLEREAIESRLGRGGDLNAFATTQELPAYQSIFGFDPGTQANRLNTATLSQDRRADFIADLLGQQTLIGDIDPSGFRAPEITADLPGFLERNQEAMNRAALEAAGLDNQFLAQGNANARRYLGDKGGFVGDILGGVTTLYGAPTLGASLMRGF